MSYKNMFDNLPHKRVDVWRRKWDTFNQPPRADIENKCEFSRYFYGVCHSIHLYFYDEMTLMFNGSIYRFGKNALFCRRPGDFSSTNTLGRNKDRYGFIYCDSKFRGKGRDLIEYIRRSDESFNPVRILTDEEAAEIRSVFDRIIEIDESGDKSLAEERRKIADAVLTRIDTIYRERKGPKPIKPSESFKKVGGIIQYICSHVGSNLTLDVLSQKFYISKFHMCRIFKREVGCTIDEFITRLRIARAIKFLNQGYSVAQTSAMLGIKNPTNFSAMFKRATGKTPKQFMAEFDV